MKIQHTWQSISGQVVSVSILWSRGHECTDFDIDDLIDTIDRKLFSHITDPNHRFATEQECMTLSRHRFATGHLVAAPISRRDVQGESKKSRPPTTFNDIFA